MRINYPMPAPASSKNRSAYAACLASHIGGFKQVGTLAELYAIPDPILSENKTGTDAIGQKWFVVSENCEYELIDWSKKTSAEGWRAVNRDDTLKELAQMASAASNIIRSTTNQNMTTLQGKYNALQTVVKWIFENGAFLSNNGSAISVPAEIQLALIESEISAS